MADLSISIDGRPIEVSIESGPNLEVSVETPSLVFPVSEVGIPGPPGQTGPPGPQGSPGPTGAPGPPAVSQVTNVTPWPIQAGGSGVSSLSAPPSWAIVGMWTWLGVGPNNAFSGYGKITGVDLVNNQISFSNWVPVA